MAKKASKMTAAEIAQEMQKRADSLDHLRARAELERRRSRYMMISAIRQRRSQRRAPPSPPSWPPSSPIAVAAKGRATSRALGKPCSAGEKGRGDGKTEAAAISEATATTGRAATTAAGTLIAPRPMNGATLTSEKTTRCSNGDGPQKCSPPRGRPQCRRLAELVTVADD